MRSVIWNYIKALKLKSITLTEHLPWEDNGAPIYHHNKKHIYVNTSNTVQQPVFDQLNGGGAVNETITVEVYFVCDAKQLPTNYDSLVEAIKGARTTAGTEGYIQKLCQVSSSYNTDAIITHLEFSFRKLITN